MTAKEIFEKEGFVLYESFNCRIHDDLIAWKNEKLDCFIYFYKNSKVEIRCDKSLNINVYRAIVKQVEELENNND